MAYGLVNTPAVFQAFVNNVFRDMLNRFVMICLDDILIHSRTFLDHLQHVSEVLRHLRGYGLYVKVEKCEFHK